jgi:hypothetical protein
MAPQPLLGKLRPKMPTRVSASVEEVAIVRQRNRMTLLSCDKIEHG